MKLYPGSIIRKQIVAASSENISWQSHQKTNHGSLSWNYFLSIDKQHLEIKFISIDKQPLEIKFISIDKQPLEIKFQSIDKQHLEIKFISIDNQPLEIKFLSIDKQPLEIKFISIDNQPLEIKFQSIDNQPLEIKFQPIDKQGILNMGLSIIETYFVTAGSERVFCPLPARGKTWFEHQVCLKFLSCTTQEFFLTYS